MISKSKKILFFYDHSIKIGNGHLQRCIYFSKIFPNYYNFKFLNSKNFNWLNKKKHFYEIIVIDSYKISFNEELFLKKICNKLISIDDYRRKYFLSDIIINYSDLAKKNFYKDNKNKFLLGQKYNFIKTNEKLEKYKLKKKFNLFLYFGLRDRKKIIDKIIYELKNKKIINKIFVFGGGKKFTSHFNFLNKMNKSDIVLISSGVSLQEALNKKKYIFATYFSNNQKNFFKFYKKKKLIHDIKDFPKFINLTARQINIKIKKKINKLKKIEKIRLNKNEYFRLIKKI